VIKGDLVGRRDLFDFQALADEDGHSEATIMEETCGADHARVIAIGKDDPFGMAPEFGVDGLEKRHLTVMVEKIAPGDKDVPSHRVRFAF